MNDIGPLPLRHSWPLWERSVHFDLGHVLNSAVTDAVLPIRIGALGIAHTGVWECDFSVGSSLAWSGGVYDIFGLERGSEITRDKALAHYCEDSRTKLEAIRAHAVRHKRGFTIDVGIHAAAVGENRRMRIIAAPLCQGTEVTGLHGLKFII